MDATGRDSIATMLKIPMALESLTPGRFRDLVRERLVANARIEPPDPTQPLGIPSDFDLNPEALADWPVDSPAKPAAVLVPVIARSPLTVLLTRRADDLPAHAGQIAFPGGRPQPEDRDLLETALREAEEEVGLDRHRIEPLGMLETYRTGTGFAVTPILGLVAADSEIRPNPREVSQIFEVPLAFLMNSANHIIHERVLGGRARRFYAMPYGEHYIWGATAGILRHMQQRLFRSS